jgi:hypothetical protein
MKTFEKKESHITERQMQELVEVTDDYELFTNELKHLLQQDKFGDFKGEAEWLKQDQTVNQAYSLVKKQRAKSDKCSVASSWRSRSYSNRSRKSSSSTSSQTRLKALAEEAAACERIMNG